MANHKNILLMIADDLGKVTSSYGGDCQTPHLDRLAATGTRFDMAFTSTASCSGSRSVIYTGLHTHENGTWGLANDRNHFMTFEHVETAPKLLNDAGYLTGIIGKVHVGPPSQYPWQVRNESWTRDVGWVADRADAFFSQANSEDKPFFLTVGFVDPHRDGVSRGGFGNKDEGYDPRIQDRKYDPASLKVPEFLPDLPEIRGELAEYYRSINRMDQGVGLILSALERNKALDNTLVIFLSDNGPPFINSKTTLYDAGVRLPFIVRHPASKPNTQNPNMISYIDIVPTILDYAGQKPNPDSPRRGRSILPILETTTELPDWSLVFGSHTLHEITNYWPTRFIRTRRYKYHRNLTWQLPFPFATDLYMSLTWEAIRNSRRPTPTASSFSSTSNPASTSTSTTGPSPIDMDGSPIMIGPRPLTSYLHRPPEELYDLDLDPSETHNLATATDVPASPLLRSLRHRLETWQLATGDRFLFRDGVSVPQCMEYDRTGDEQPIRIPDRWDLDTERPGNREGDVEGVVGFGDGGEVRSLLY